MYEYQRLRAPLVEPNRLENRLYLANVRMPFTSFFLLGVMFSGRLTVDMSFCFMHDVALSAGRHSANLIETVAQSPDVSEFEVVK